MLTTIHFFEEDKKSLVFVFALCLPLKSNFHLNLCRLHENYEEKMRVKLSQWRDGCERCGKCSHAVSRMEKLPREKS